MRNPWEDISLEDYENHMKLGSVYQLQMLNRIVREQLCRFSVDNTLILGIAGGNGLEHVDKLSNKKIYGFDVNSEYLEECTKRFPLLENIFIPICGDFVDQTLKFPDVQLVIANLFIEYVGVRLFANRMSEIFPQYISAAIQVDSGDEFVSDSPYIHSFENLTSIHSNIKKEELISELEIVGYSNIYEESYILPNGKKLVRLDFETSN